MDGSFWYCAWLVSFLLVWQEILCSLGDSVSQICDVEYGIPQGSILGPILFSLYMLPLGKIISLHNVHYHCYADDLQLYISVSSGNPRGLNSLFSCLKDITIWMNNFFLKLNEQKTEILLVGPLEERQKLQLMFGSLSQQIKSQMTSLGVILILYPILTELQKYLFFILGTLQKLDLF